MCASHSPAFDRSQKLFSLWLADFLSFSRILDVSIELKAVHQLTSSSHPRLFSHDVGINTSRTRLIVSPHQEIQKIGSRRLKGRKRRRRCESVLVDDVEPFARRDGSESSSALFFFFFFLRKSRFFFFEQVMSF